MNLQIYKPNSKNSGAAFNFSIDTRGEKPIFYVNAILQHSWNDSTKTGSFSGNKDNPDKKLAIKLNEFELGEMLSTFNTRIPWSGFHDFNDNKTSISLTPWDKTKKLKDKTGNFHEFVLPAFGFSVTRNGSQNFRISLEPGEAEVLKRFIGNYLDLFLKSTSKMQKNNSSNSPNRDNSVNQYDDDPSGSAF